MICKPWNWYNKAVRLKRKTVLVNIFQIKHSKTAIKKIDDCVLDVANDKDVNYIGNMGYGLKCNLQ